MSEHTKEPWYVEKPFKDMYGNVKDDETWISANNRRDEWHGLAVTFSTPNCRGADKENARRIVACVNACAGIKTEQLVENTIFMQIDVFKDLQDACYYRDQYKGQRDELILALKVVRDYFDGQYSSSALREYANICVNNAINKIEANK